MAEDEPPSFKGGKVTARDTWYGLTAKPDFRDFRRWWHRAGEFEYGRDYIAGKAEADEVYGRWVSSNRPRVK